LAVGKPGVADSRGPPEQPDQRWSYFPATIAGLSAVTLPARLGEISFARGCVAGCSGIGCCAKRKQNHWRDAHANRHEDFLEI
jgi:hypothetical protein